MREREKNYQDIISKLTDKFSIVEDMQKDVEDIKSHIFKKINKIFKIDLQSK